jgi:EAL domain-containing protein (putative c-di-GMP-specific phosphodiesterase class I)
MHQVLPDRALMASIRIFYQPIVRLEDMRPDYVEVLARAAGPDGSMGGPESIVDAMTCSERSMRLTASIMRRTLAEYEEFGFAGNDLSIAFNLPLDAMLHPDLLERLAALREISRLPAEKIRFELTERHPVHDLEAAYAAISDLRDAGYGLALDDITPDMPYLAELLEMPIRAIKLDRSVVTSAHPADQAFISEMTLRAAANQQDIIAEGIETPRMRDQMREMGVTHAQGYLFSRPLPAVALEQYLFPKCPT